MINNLNDLVQKYKDDLENYYKEYKYTDNTEYWEALIHITERVIDDLEKLLNNKIY